MVAAINAQIDGRGRDRQAPTPPDLPTPRHIERDLDVETETPRTIRKQKLANLALGNADDVA
jgi:hypothetical protein